MLLDTATEAGRDITVVTWGQSLVAQLFSGNATGEAAMQAALDAANPEYVNTIINAANGGSFITKTSHDASGLANDEYWVNDDNAPTYTAGPLLTALYGFITAAGKNNNDVNVVYGSICASEATYISNGTITKAELKAAKEWLYDNFIENFPNLISIVQQFIENTTNERDGYQPIRDIDGELELERTNVFGTAPNYDGTKADTIHFTDDAAGYGKVGTRGGNSIARSIGLSVKNGIGPQVESATLSGTSLVLKINHDSGSTLNNYSGSAVDVSATTDSENFFTVQDSDENIINPTAVQVTNFDEITLTLPIEPVSDVTVYSGFASMGIVDLTETIVSDDQGLPVRGYAIARSADFSNLTAPLMLFSAERDPNNTSQPRYYDTAASSGADVWTNIGSGNNARRDGSDAAPSWVADLSATISGAPAVPAIYADGSDAIKLLVEHALTTTSACTLFVKYHPDTTVVDSVGGARNTVASFAGAATNGTHLGIATVKNDADDMDHYIGGLGGAFSGGVSGDFADGGTFVVQWVDSTNGNHMNTASNSWTAVDHSGNTSVIDSDGGTPLFAIANDVDKPTGTSGSTMTGGIMFVLLASTAYSEAQAAHIVAAMDNIIAGGAGYTLGL